jgi:hypothetical protein
MDKIILTPEEFAPIFASAWYIVIDGDLYEKIDDYEDDEGKLITIFQFIDYSETITVPYDTVEKVCNVQYDPDSAEYRFIGTEDAEAIPAFQILGLVKPDRK